MKLVQRLLLILVACFFIGSALPNMGIAVMSTISQYPEDTIVVPMGTGISIDDDVGTVTIIECSINISDKS